MTTPEICALCGMHAKLDNSHLIPKFVYKWMKSNSPTGHVIQAMKPSVRLQDGPKVKLLCRRCEGRIGEWEREFAERLFRPFQHNRRAPVTYRYNEWLLRYAVAQAWRTSVTTASALFRLEEPLAALAAGKALNTWRQYLLHNQADPGPYQHHLWLFDVDDVPEPDVRHTYLRWGVDATFFCHSDVVRAYTKLPGMVLWSAIAPPTVQGWQNTVIRASGSIEPPQSIRDDAFYRFFFGRAVRAANLYARGESTRAS